MRRRLGFTLTELLVSMALIIFVMYILADAFDAGITSFGQLKAIGDINEKLRSTSATIRKYLSADHFEGKRRLSDPNFWTTGPPREGFFRIVEGSDGVNEGVDLDGLPSYRSVDHALHFAVKLRGNQRGEYFRASVPSGSPLLTVPFALSHFQDSTTANTYCSPWAEVAFFLRPTGLSTRDPNNPGAAGTPLYALYMRQCLTVPDGSGFTVQTSVGGYNDISCTTANNPLSTGNYYFNSPADLPMPGRRALLNSDIPGTLPSVSNVPNGTYSGYQTLGDLNLSPSQQGNDLILTNVLSFDVRVLLSNGTDFVSLYGTGMPSMSNSTNYGTSCIGGTNKVFDTWSQGSDEAFNNGGVATNPSYLTWATANTQWSAPMPNITIKAIRVTIRVWDTRTFQSRQTSVIVDM